MSMTDPLGDMLTRIRNGQQARKSTVMAPASKLRSSARVSSADIHKQKYAPESMS